MCIVNCALQQAVGLHRSVENDVPTLAFRRNAAIGQVTVLHSYGMRRLGFLPSVTFLAECNNVKTLDGLKK
ncbi:MAG: hypothetical protein LBQ66_10585 [Planctomycetaceae bacterium]|nr:hypothetical protein [Planctomycetaceae bacterium]